MVGGLVLAVLGGADWNSFARIIKPNVVTAIVPRSILKPRIRRVINISRPLATRVRRRRVG